MRSPLMVLLALAACSAPPAANPAVQVQPPVAAKEPLDAPIQHHWQAERTDQGCRIWAAGTVLEIRRGDKDRIVINAPEDHRSQELKIGTSSIGALGWFPAGGQQPFSEDPTLVARLLAAETVAVGWKSPEDAEAGGLLAWLSGGWNWDAVDVRNLRSAYDGCILTDATPRAKMGHVDDEVGG